MVLTRHQRNQLIQQGINVPLLELGRNTVARARGVGPAARRGIEQIANAIVPAIPQGVRDANEVAHQLAVRTAGYIVQHPRIVGGALVAVISTMYRTVRDNWMQAAQDAWDAGQAVGRAIDPGTRDHLRPQPLTRIPENDQAVEPAEDRHPLAGFGSGSNDEDPRPRNRPAGSPTTTAPAIQAKPKPQGIIIQNANN